MLSGLSNKERGFITIYCIFGQLHFNPIPQEGFCVKICGMLFSKHHSYGWQYLAKN